MVLFLAFILSLDALGIAVSYKIRKIFLPLISKFIICVMSVAATYVSVAFGNIISSAFNIKTATYFGCAMLFLTGIWIIATSTDTNKKSVQFNKKFNLGNITITIVKEPEKCDFDNSHKLEAKEALYMGIVLSLDSFCSGIGLGFTKIPAWIISMLIGVFQFILLYIGEMTGNLLVKWKILNEKTCIVLSGLVLIITAIIKLF